MMNTKEPLNLPKMVLVAQASVQDLVGPHVQFNTPRPEETITHETEKNIPFMGCNQEHYQLQTKGSFHPTKKQQGKLTSDGTCLE